MQASAKTIMTKDLLTILSGTSLHQAATLMKAKQIRHLPVVNPAGEIVGIISKTDLKSVLGSELIPVDYVMSTPIMSIDQNAPLRTAIGKILHNKISSLLISDQSENAIGIITTDDLLWYLAYRLEEPKEKHFSFSSLFDLHTIGEAARQISLAGI